MKTFSVYCRVDCAPSYYIVALERIVASPWTLTPRREKRFRGVVYVKTFYMLQLFFSFFLKIIIISVLLKFFNIIFVKYT